MPSTTAKRPERSGKRAAANSLRFLLAPEADQSHCLSTTQLAYS